MKLLFFFALFFFQLAYVFPMVIAIFLNNQPFIALLSFFTFLKSTFFIL